MPVFPDCLPDAAPRPAFRRSSWRGAGRRPGRWPRSHWRDFDRLLAHQDHDQRFPAPPATPARIRSLPDMLWKAMGLSSVRTGLVTALVAAFAALFVLTAAFDAAACAPEAAAAAAVAGVAEGPSGGNSGDAPDDHAICAHGHCHHGGAMAFERPDFDPGAMVARELRRIPPDTSLASRTPSGLDRPPRG